jgi:hypothetical protein
MVKYLAWSPLLIFEERSTRAHPALHAYIDNVVVGVHVAAIRETVQWDRYVCMCVCYVHACIDNVVVGVPVAAIRETVQWDRYVYVHVCVCVFVNVYMSYTCIFRECGWGACGGG